MDLGDEGTGGVGEEEEGGEAADEDCELVVRRGVFVVSKTGKRNINIPAAPARGEPLTM